MSRLSTIIEVLTNEPNGLLLKEICNRGFHNLSNSNYMGTYHCLRDHRHLFERVSYGVYKYNPQPELAVDLEEETPTELIQEAMGKDKLRANEVWHRILNSGKSIGYRTVLHPLNNSGLFLKEGLYYTAI